MHCTLLFTNVTQVIDHSCTPFVAYRAYIWCSHAQIITLQYSVYTDAVHFTCWKRAGDHTGAGVAIFGQHERGILDCFPHVCHHSSTDTSTRSRLFFKCNTHPTLFLASHKLYFCLLFTLLCSALFPFYMFLSYVCGQDRFDVWLILRNWLRRYSILQSESNPSAAYPKFANANTSTLQSFVVYEVSEMFLEMKEVIVV